MKPIIAVMVAMALMGIVALVIAADGLRDDVQVCDAGVVLGSKVMPDGAPSDRLRARLDKAAALYRQGMFKHIIVSGGTGVEGFSEGRVMADYLVGRQSIPAAVILVDEHGDTTEATARNSAAILKAHGLRSTLVVTQFFHITRSRHALHDAGVETVYSAHANYFEARDVYSLAREVIAVPVYWIGRAKPAA